MIFILYIKKYMKALIWHGQFPTWCSGTMTTKLANIIIRLTCIHSLRNKKPKVLFLLILANMNYTEAEIDQVGLFLKIIFLSMTMWMLTIQCVSSTEHLFSAIDQYWSYFYIIVLVVIKNNWKVNKYFKYDNKVIIRISQQLVPP